MKKWVQNYLVFTIMLPLGLFQAVSGLLMWLVIPQGGYQGGRGVASTEVAFLLVMLIIHIILHWKWIVHMTKKVFSSG